MIYHTSSSLRSDTTNMFQGSRLRFQKACKKKEPPQSKATLTARISAVENLMTLKQACSSEYQEAQDAFKDSMIH